MKSMKEPLSDLARRAIASGLLISIGCKVYLMTGGFFGAFLFSIALLCIVRYGLPLYTGKAGYKTPYPELIYILFFNMLGAFAGSICFGSMLPLEVIESRFIPSLPLIFKAMGCGALMYLAVDLKEHPYVTIMAVMTFIMAGFEHSIADIAYIGTQLLNFPAAILLIIFGNLIGAKLMRILSEKSTIPESNQCCTSAISPTGKNPS